MLFPLKLKMHRLLKPLLMPHTLLTKPLPMRKPLKAPLHKPTLLLKKLLTPLKALLMPLPTPLTKLAKLRSTKLYQA